MVIIMTSSRRCLYPYFSTNLPADSTVWLDRRATLIPVIPSEARNLSFGETQEKRDSSLRRLRSE